jgi:TPR repeat protein
MSYSLAMAMLFFLSSVFDVNTGSGANIGAMAACVFIATRYFIQHNKGDAKSQNDLGSLYQAGQVVPQDYTEAARWYER